MNYCYRILCCLVFLLGFSLITQAAPPVVSNVRALQRTDGSLLVDIYYDVEAPDRDHVIVSVMISDDGGSSYSIAPVTLEGDFGEVAPGAGKHIVWDAGKDIPNVYGVQFKAAVMASDPNFTLTIDLPNLSSRVQPLEMVLIPAGTFMMGSPDDEQDRQENEGPQHEVTISKPFYMSKFEVTQAQWEAVMDSNPSYNINKPDCPVEYVSWLDCIQFIAKLNQKGLGTFRLPTEAEWEYACRAGTTTRYYWGDDPDAFMIGDYAWYLENAGLTTHNVGLKLPNQWNLYDMCGNVNEWCLDMEGPYTTIPQTDPFGPTKKLTLIIRGGYWYNETQYCRSASRTGINPDGYGGGIGFRLQRSYP